MFALLKLVSAKDWLYIGLFITLSAIFGWYTVHERHIGQAQIEALDAKLAAAQAAHNKLVEDTALETINVTAQKYHAAITTPVASPQHVIVRYSSGSNGLSQATVCTGGASSTTVVSGTGTVDIGTASGSDVVSTDIGPSLDQLSSNADAEVIALQAIIAADRAETK